MAPVDIFLSFRGADLELARTIDEILRAAGLRVWFYPRSSPGGAHFPHEINQALAEAKTVLVLLTPNFYSDSIATKGEFDYGWLEGKLRVFRSRTGGQDWEPLTRGLPQEHCYVNVLRDAMAVDSLDDCGVYFGTTGGQVYGSADSGDTWAPIVRDLPAVLSVEVQTLP